MFGIGKEEAIPKSVFECRFKCCNCCYEWNQQFQRGTEIIQETKNVAAMQGKKGANIVCPNCLSETILVVKRNVFQEEIRTSISTPMQQNPQVQITNGPTYEELMETIRRGMIKQGAIIPPVSQEYPQEKVDKRRKLQ